MLVLKIPWIIIMESLNNFSHCSNIVLCMFNISLLNFIWCDVELRFKTINAFISIVFICNINIFLSNLYAFKFMWFSFTSSIEINQMTVKWNNTWMIIWEQSSSNVLSFQESLFSFFLLFRLWIYFSKYF